MMMMMMMIIIIIIFLKIFFRIEKNFIKKKFSK